MSIKGACLFEDGLSPPADEQGTEETCALRNAEGECIKSSKGACLFYDREDRSDICRCVFEV
jgi:hypothetical protein